jgi:hypothetical protein
VAWAGKILVTRVNVQRAIAYARWVHGSDVTDNQNLQLFSFEGSCILGKAVFINTVKDKKLLHDTTRHDTTHRQSSVAMHFGLHKV